MFTAVSGSVATDHLMRFPGRFADHILGERLDTLSLSFLVESLAVRRGGVAANIAYGMGKLGRRPLLIGAVGADFAEHRSLLESLGVDCSDLLVVDSEHTGRFTCTTDKSQCQLAAFYPGAMAESARIDLLDILVRQAPDLILIGASDPASMLTQTAVARAHGTPFAADPSQQLPRLSGDECRQLIDGAAILFSNSYEWDLLLHKTEWTTEEIESRVGLRVTTAGADGVLLSRHGDWSLRVPAFPAVECVDPTGVGDGFRAGFLTGIECGLSLESATQLGTYVATQVLDTDGAQEWELDVPTAERDLRSHYGAEAAATIGSAVWATGTCAVVPADG